MGKYFFLNMWDNIVCALLMQTHPMRGLIKPQARNLSHMYFAGHDILVNSPNGESVSKVTTGTTRPCIKKWVNFSYFYAHLSFEPSCDPCDWLRCNVADGLKAFQRLLSAKALIQYRPQEGIGLKSMNSVSVWTATNHKTSPTHSVLSFLPILSSSPPLAVYFPPLLCFSSSALFFVCVFPIFHSVQSCIDLRWWVAGKTCSPHFHLLLVIFLISFCVSTFPRKKKEIV